MQIPQPIEVEGVVVFVSGPEIGLIGPMAQLLPGIVFMPSERLRVDDRSLEFPPAQLIAAQHSIQSMEKV